MRALISTPSEERAAEIKEIGDPVPTSGETVVEVRAAGLNRGELRLLPMRDGWGPGQDVAGVVVEPDESGAGPPAGSRVVALSDQGGWAERVAVPVERVATLPDEVFFEEAAALPVAGLTALRMLRLGGNLLGRRVLVTGAAGGVGRFAVELGAHAGADVTAIARGGERAAGLEEIGAAAIASAIIEAGGDFDLVLESAGGASLTAALKCVARGGTVVSFGNSSGEPSEVDFRNFVERANASLYAFRVYESGDKPSFGEDLALLARLVAEQRLHPHIGWTGSWRDLEDAMTSLRERRVNGKAVLTID